MYHYSNIILAEDDEDDLFLFQQALNKLFPGGTFTHAKDGEELMSILPESVSKETILFLDINMPRKNGLECLQELRTQGLYTKLPVIIISTHKDTQIMEHAYSIGANFYMAKAVDFNKFIKDIKSIISTQWI
jgi:DNA-binding NarL/FixJ family response regulator